MQGSERDRWPLEVTCRLHVGSRAEVWLARPRDGAGRVVLKRLLQPSPTGAASLEREAALQRSLRHPQVVEALGLVADPLDDRGSPALVLEVADAGSLAEVVARSGSFTAGELVAALCPVAAALSSLHDLGYVHGDVSPANLLYDRCRGPLLADFGSALPIGSTLGRQDSTTLRFAAPEHRPGAQADPRADVYALGTTALTLLAVSRRPAGRSAASAGPLVGVLLRAVQSDPAARHPSMAHLLADLTRRGAVADAESLRRHVERRSGAVGQSAERVTVPGLVTKRFGAPPSVPPASEEARRSLRRFGRRAGRARRRCDA